MDGLQDEMVLVALPNGRWGRPVGGRPSTHILKLDDERFPGLVAAEAACLQLALAVGVTTATATTRVIGGRQVLIVERFDRAPPADAPVRVHHEDACQALGLDPTRPYKGRPNSGKYQVGGGPSG